MRPIVLFALLIDYYSNFEFFKGFPTEYFFEKYTIRKLRYFSSKFNWKFETKYAGSQSEIDIYDVHPLLKTPESLTSYISIEHGTSSIVSFKWLERGIFT
jgi:hypothetical protein